MLELTLTAATLLVAAVDAVPLLAAPRTRSCVTESDHRAARAATATAGKTTCAPRNAGERGHDSWLRGGGQTVPTRVIGVGRTARLATTLTQGIRYGYRCRVG